MADIPDYMRDFDMDQDYGFTPVSSKPTESKPSVDPKLVENSNIEISKVKSDVSSIKSMMNEIMQIVAEKETIAKETTTEEQKKDLKKLRKLYYRFYITYQSQMNLIYIGQIEDQLLRHK